MQEMLRRMEEEKVKERGKPSPDKGTEGDGWNAASHLALYDNDMMINRFEKREEFIREIGQLQARSDAKGKDIAGDDLKETARIIKEFDFRNYDKRFNVDIGTVLAALLGAQKAEKELLKNGMLHSYSNAKKSLTMKKEH
jgi:hypothetical protein